MFSPRSLISNVFCLSLRNQAVPFLSSRPFVRPYASHSYEDLLNYGDDCEGLLNQGIREGNPRLCKAASVYGARDWNRALITAAGSGYIEMVKFVLDKGAICFDEAIEAADKGGHEEISRMLDARKSFSRYTV